MQESMKDLQGTHQCGDGHKGKGAENARSFIVQTWVDGLRCNVDARAKNRNNGAS